MKKLLKEFGLKMNKLKLQTKMKRLQKFRIKIGCDGEEK